MAQLLSRRSEWQSPSFNTTMAKMSNLRDEQFVEIACEHFPTQVREEYAGLLRQLTEGVVPSAREACRHIAEQLAARKVNARLALKFHLATMESVIETLGPQCAKKVLTCGDVIVLELMSALSEAYGQCSSSLPPPNTRRRSWLPSGAR